MVEHEWFGCGQMIRNKVRDFIEWWHVKIFNEIYIFMFCMLILLSSPYLLVFGDDRVRGTREQRMLMQVELVTLSCGDRISGVFYLTCIFYYWKWIVNSFETFILDYDTLVIMNHYLHLWKFKFPAFLGKVLLLNVTLLVIFFILFKLVISWRDVTRTITFVTQWGAFPSSYF